MEKKIGQGQFSVVYRAKNLVTGQIVALKKIQIFDMVDAKARQDCIKEIDLLKVGCHDEFNVCMSFGILAHKMLTYPN